MKNRFALDIAQGMAHVHGLNRMHRDLKSGNCLVSSTLRIKVADFGTCAFTDITSLKVPHPITEISTRQASPISQISPLSRYDPSL